MSFVFSAGNQEEKRQSEKEQREKQKASSEISAGAQLDITESKLGPDQNTHKHSDHVCVPSEKEKNHNYYRVALQHNLTHRSQNVPRKGSTIVSLYTGTKGETPRQRARSRPAPASGLFEIKGILHQTGLGRLISTGKEKEKVYKRPAQCQRWIPKKPSSAKPRDRRVKGHILKTTTKRIKRATVSRKPRTCRCFWASQKVHYSWIWSCCYSTLLHKGWWNIINCSQGTEQLDKLRKKPPRALSHHGLQLLNSQLRANNTKLSYKLL